MDFKGVLSSPYVWVGGAALGLVALVAGGSKASTVQGPNAGFSPDEVRAWSDYNRDAYGAITRQAELAGSLAEKRVEADVIAKGHLLSFLAAADRNRTALAMQRDESMAGIVQTSLTTQASVIIDAQQNAARIKMAAIDADARKYLAAQQGEAQKWGATMGAVTDLAQTAAKFLVGA